MIEIVFHRIGQYLWSFIDTLLPLSALGFAITLLLLVATTIVGVKTVLGFKAVKSAISARSPETHEQHMSNAGADVVEWSGSASGDSQLPTDWQDSDSDSGTHRNEHQQSPTVPFTLPVYTDREMLERASAFNLLMQSRRTVRHFSPQPIPLAAVRYAVQAAASAPSGAHMQPWTFVSVTRPALKAQIRRLVETEEQINYQRRMGDQWVADLKHLGTSWRKRYLTQAPLLLLVFRHAYRTTNHMKTPKYGMKSSADETTEQQVKANGAGDDSEEESATEQRGNTYYSEISVSIACGLLIAALHQMGLATLTSTPLHCGQQLRRLLQRPRQERLVLLMPVGRPADGCRVPHLIRKPLDQVLIEM